MGWIDNALEKLAASRVCGYRAGRALATEPTALVAMALVAHGRWADANPAVQWLAARQNPDGSVGVTESEKSPCWPTSLAVLAWRASVDAGDRHHGDIEKRIDAAVAWLLEAKGEAIPRMPGMGHDSTLVGWSWVTGTHSWVEPTALALLALKATGHADHPRAREAARLLVDRLLPGGGCNYGNTVVLDQTLRPHLLPTGMALLALAGERIEDGRVERSLAYLARETSDVTSCLSLGYSLLALAAHDRLPASADTWLAGAVARASDHGTEPWKLAPLVMVDRGAQGPLVALPRKVAP